MRSERTRQRTPSWGLVSSSAAPVLLIGGWTLAAARQPDGFDPVVETISALAARDASDRWVMTVALTGLGVCHVVTALALRAAARPGRWLLAGGGAATVVVAAFPLPTGDGHSTPHTVAASTAFLALAAWPALAARRSATAAAVPAAAETPALPAVPVVPVVLRPAVALPAAAVLLGLVAWFGAELSLDGRGVGLSERVAAGAQALWPLTTVASVVLSRGTQSRLRRR